MSQHLHFLNMDNRITTWLPVFHFIQVQQDCKVPVFKHVQKEYIVPVFIQFKTRL